MTDVSSRYSTIASAFSARVQGTTDWSATSPCDGWTARDVVAHVVGVHRGVVAGATDTPPQELSADDDIATAWTAATAALLSVLENPEQAAKVANGPFGPMPVEQLVGRLICNDTLIHTWDLARATGQDETLDAASCEGALSGLKPLDGMIRGAGFFGPKLDTPEGAGTQVELLRFLGRPA